MILYSVASCKLSTTAGKNSPILWSWAIIEKIRKARVIRALLLSGAAMPFQMVIWYEKSNTPYHDERNYKNIRVLWQITEYLAKSEKRWFCFVVCVRFPSGIPPSVGNHLPLRSETDYTTWERAPGEVFDMPDSILRAKMLNFEAQRGKTEKTLKTKKITLLNFSN